jgi:EAL domain-containing protein (putative c-di-GMP-specific phosphodiesterase class I)
LTVAGQGVESFEQLKVLAIEVKPDMFQGFLFGSALTAQGIETMSNMTWPFGQQISDSLSVEA